MSPANDQFWDTPVEPPAPGLPTMPRVVITPRGPALDVAWGFYSGKEYIQQSERVERGPGVTGRLRGLLRDVVGRKDYERITQTTLSSV